MDLHTYKHTVLQRARQLPPEQQIRHALLGMVTEAGEIADIYKKLLAYGKKVSATHLMEECGDYLWYLVLWVTAEDRANGLLAEFNRVARHTEDSAGGKTADTLQTRDDDDLLDRLVVMTAGMLAAQREDMIDQMLDEQVPMSIFCVVHEFCLRAGCSLAECLQANDAKLEARTGQAFDASRFLNRDLDNEAAVLKQHGKD